MVSLDICGARWSRWFFRPSGLWRVIVPRGLSGAVVAYVVVTVGKTHVFSKGFEFYVAALDCCH